MPVSPHESDKQAVLEALGALRRAIRRYWEASGEPPYFVLEKGAPSIPPDRLVNCRVLPGREALLETLPAGGCVAEVGTQHGHWARKILDSRMPSELHLFDLDFSALRDDVRLSPVVSLHAGDSSCELASQPDGVFDWIYIDADHSYLGALRDADVAAKKIRRGGVLVFNDYVTWSPIEAVPYGVQTVVNELLNGSWEMRSIALSYHGYFDVALARRDE